MALTTPDEGRAASESSTLSPTTVPMALVAQRIEQRIPNPEVAGSIPAEGALIKWSEERLHNLSPVSMGLTSRE